MKRVLILTSVASMIDQFNMPNIRLLQEMGYVVDVACNFKIGNTCSDEKVKELERNLKKMGVYCYQIDFARDIINVWENIKAFWQIEYLLEKNKYEFIHCHSPIGGVIGRMTGRLKQVKVIYTAHGFHFYKGAPLKNWLVYYPIEKLCSYMTDILICINREDYILALKKMKAKKIQYIPGIGIDLGKFGEISVNPSYKRRELAIPDNKLWLLSVGELIKRKNHENLIRAMAEIKDVYLTIAGQGALKKELEKLIYDLKIDDRVKLIGFRTDISELCQSADVFVLPSYQEGLSVALMEAMASGKPIVCSKIRGNVDLVDEKKGGVMFMPNDVFGCKKALLSVQNMNFKEMGLYNKKKIQIFSIEHVKRKMEKIYGAMDEF